MNIEELKRKLLVKYPFFGSIITDVEYKEASFIPTAATDGQKILYNEEFMKSKTLDEQVFILAHEVCHIVAPVVLHFCYDTPKCCAFQALIACPCVEILPKMHGRIKILEDFVANSPCKFYTAIRKS